MVVREEVRDGGWEVAVTQVLDDCRYALRRLRKNPGSAVAAVATLALGVGATATIFAVIDGVLVKPLPYPHAERLVALWHTAPGINLRDLKMAPSLYYTYREDGRVFEDVAIWNGNRSTVTGLGDPEEAPTLFVTHSFLNVLGVQPAIGRGFTEADGDVKNDRTVILSDGYWRQRFGASAGAIGQRMILDGNAHTVIGVLPRGFEFLDEKISLVVPRRLRREEVLLIQFSEDGIARLRPGVTVDQANADVARCLLLAEKKFPMNPGFTANAFADARISPRLRSLKDHLIGDVGKSIWVLMGAVGLLLLIACANVANLLLVRADGRQQELAVREALGAGWGRITRDLLTESVLLGMAGGLIGLVFCSAAVRWVANSSIPQLPRLGSIALDERTVAFTAVISVAAGILFGLVPVWRYAPRRRSAGVSAGGRSFTLSKDRHATQQSLLVMQVALAMVLLTGAGLMLRTVQALRSVDPGFSGAEQVQMVRVSIPSAQVSAPEQVLRMEEAILRKFAGVAGVSAVNISTAPPMQGGSANPVYAEGVDLGAGKLPPVRSMRSTSPGWVAATGSRFVAGRDFSWEEIYRGAELALISENMAREVWSGARDAVGKRIRISPSSPWREVIGVVADLRDDGVTRRAPAIVYWPLMQKRRDGTASVPRNVDYMVRSPRAGTVGFVDELRQALREVNGNLPLANVRTLESVYRKSMARSAFVLMLLAVAGMMALVLGVVGIYGVVAYAVAQRRKEIGIRIALGAPVAGVTGMFVKQGLRLAGIGAVVGAVASLGATRLLQTLLFGVSPVDVWTYAGIMAVLVMAALVASWVPARRAATVDPIEALRAE
ncbi:MAG: ABC transporter permease [Acidobacteria bacterium]|nr:ABC transporter permease [Acidobacteriota bacterium]